MPAAPNTPSSYFSLTRDPKMKSLLFSFCINNNPRSSLRAGTKIPGLNSWGQQHIQSRLKNSSRKSNLSFPWLPFLVSIISSTSSPKTRGQR